MVTNPNLAPLGGLPARRPDQMTSTPPVAVSPGPSAGIVRAAEIIIIGTGPAILVYNPSAGLGNLIGSWAGAAGTDPYGNSYPEGLNVTVGTISGTTIDGTDYIINQSGAFWYSGTPAHGNLILSLAAAAGSDGFGNAYPEGLGVTQGSVPGGLLTAGSVTGTAIAAGTITASNIAASTITATQLAAGIIYAGIINGTTVNAATFTGSTFDGTDFILNTAGMFFYSGTPGSGNLVLSAARTSGSDGFGNSYYAGYAAYNNSSNQVVQLNSNVIDFYNTGFSTSTPLLSLQVTSTGQAKITSPGGAELLIQSFSAIDFQSTDAVNFAGIAVGASSITGAASDIEIQNCIGFNGRSQPSASSVGYLYMRASDQSLCFKGTGGTNTVLAGP